MSAKRNVHEETVEKAKEYLVLEERYWKVLVKKAKLVTVEEINAKELIIDAIYNVGAEAAIKTEKRSLMHDL